MEKNRVLYDQCQAPFIDWKWYVPLPLMIRNPYARRHQRTRESSLDGRKENRPIGSVPTGSPPVVDSVKRPSQHKNTDAYESTDASALIIAAADKAGMQRVDRARVDAIILRESGNSLFMQQQRRRDEKVNARIVAMKRKMESFRPPPVDSDRTSIATMIQERPQRSVYCVIDMDMFYMACELLTHPQLRDKPACVGGGLILTSNYRAREYGVRSAMAGYIGDSLVRELSGGLEELVHVKANYQLYQEKSRLVINLLREYDPTLKSYSLDEAYLNLGPYLALHLRHPDWDHDEIKNALVQSVPEDRDARSEFSTEDSDERIRQQITQNDDADEILAEKSFPSVWDDRANADSISELMMFPDEECLAAASALLEKIRQRVYERTGGLTCSAGMAPNFMLAKIASDFNKPNGQYVVPSDQDSIQSFLFPLPIRKVPGIGRVTEKICKAFQIDTVQHLYEQRALVQYLFTPNAAEFLLWASVGCARRESDVVGNAELDYLQKGVSRERTFRSIDLWNDIASKLEEVACLLSQDMQAKNMWARTVTVKAKMHNFDVITRARTLAHDIYIQSAKAIFDVAIELLEEVRHSHSKEQPNQRFGLRLLGIRCNNFRRDNHLTSKSEQKHLDSFLCLKQSLQGYIKPQKENNFQDMKCTAQEQVSPQNVNCREVT